MVTINFLSKKPYFKEPNIEIKVFLVVTEEGYEPPTLGL